MKTNTKPTNPMKVITGKDTRWSYANVWEAKSINGGAPKFSVSLIIPKTDTVTVGKIKSAIQAAYEEGRGKLRGNGKNVPPLSAIKTPLRDGDTERPDDPAYAGCYFINANSATAPGIVDTKDAEGHLVIDPAQAEVVKRIYREYLEGYSMDKIAAGLERDGILTGAGKTKWHTSTINKILRNEKYIGDALLQKTYTTDFLNKTRVKNNGIVPQYYVENDHEAIVPRDIFMRVQEELVRRSFVKPGPNGKKHTYSCNHCFSQMIVCGECGEQFRRIHWNNRGYKSIVWRCVSRLEPTGMECHARTVNEQELERVVVAALNELLGDRKGYQRQLQQNIAAVIHASATASTDAIDEKLLALQQELLKKAHNKEAYDEIADEIFQLREQKQRTAVDTVARDEQIKRITALQDFIRSQPAELTEFDDTLVRRWFKQITIFEDHYMVELKSELKVDIDAE